MDNYTSLDTTNRLNETSNSSTLEKDNYEPLVELDIKKEESILEIHKTNDFEETISGMIKLIDNYYKDIETNDEYPYFRGRI